MSILKFSGEPRQCYDLKRIIGQGYFIVPILDRQGVGDSKPIAVDLEVCGLAGPALVWFILAVFAFKG